MKRLVVISLTFLVVIGFAACKKCTTCEIKRLNGTVEATYEEYCGSKDDIDEFKKELEQKAQLHFQSDAQVICNDN